jgi:Xaa-Pro dipeptidase
MDEKLASLYHDHIATQKERYDRALKEGGFDRAVIYAGSEHGVLFDDQAYPFKVNAHFKAWVPVVDNPHCWVAYEPGRKPLLLYWSPVDYWYKPAQPPKAFWVGEFDIKVIPEASDAIKELGGVKRTAFIGEWDDTFAKIGSLETNPKSVVEALHFERAWKTEYEIECIRRANVRGARGHVAAEKAFRAGATEYEIHLEYLRATQHGEAELPYGNIVAFNENGSVLHYQHQNREKVTPLHSFLIDAGASYNGYASDITRTYSREKDEFAELIDAMNTMQLELCDMIKPGLDYKEVHFAAHRKVGDILHRFGFIDVDGDTAFAKKLTTPFFPHGVGHYLGLQVHDVGGFSKDRTGATIPKPEGHPYLRLTRVLEPKFVFTIEPGVYFIESLLSDLRKSDDAKHVKWDKVDSFRKFGGIRIEDDIVVTESGFENLTRPAFKQVS